MSNTLPETRICENTKHEPHVERSLKDEFVAWVKSHKKELILAGVSITALIAFIFGMKNKDALVDCWRSLSKTIRNAPVSPVSAVDAAQPIAPVFEPVASITPHMPLLEEVNVRGHIRNLAEGWHHSAEKAMEAAANGYPDLLPNQTWVSPYTKSAA